MTKDKVKRLYYFSLVTAIVFLVTVNITGCSRITDIMDDDINLKDDYGFSDKKDEDELGENIEDNENEEENKNIGIWKKDKIVKETKKDNEGIVNNVNDSKNAIESAKNYGVSKYDVKAMLKGTYKGPLANEKIVFLTFDDGPSVNTPHIVKVLNDYSIHGTFFVLGQAVKNNASNLKLLYDNGNSIGNHSYSHSYKELYPGDTVSVSAYMNEYLETESAIRSVLGNSFSSNLVRMPGGEMSRRYYKDVNLASLKERFKSEKIVSIDWNSLNGDAEAKNYSVNEMIEYVKSTSAGKNHVVVLMHDTDKKYLTVRALPQIIEYFKSEGYSFKVIM